jgi:DNA-binding transcriptional LysR family regulator
MDKTEPSWEHWRAFNAAMETGTLSAAARKIGVTQPTMGRQIEALEQALGFPLFLRSQKGLTPTEAATGMAPMAHTMAATAEALQRMSEGGRDSESGTVRLSTSHIMGARIIPDIIAEFTDRYPRIAVEINVTNALDDLLTREADVAIRMVEPAQQALVAKKIGEVEIGLYAHKKYLDKHGAPLSLNDIGDHRVIGFDALRVALKPLQESGFDVTRTDFSIRSDNDMTQLALVESGAGVGGMQETLARRNPNLVRVLANQFRWPLGTWIVMHEDLRHGGPTRLMFDHLVDRLGAFIRES